MLPRDETKEALLILYATMPDWPNTDEYKDNIALRLRKGQVISTPYSRVKMTIAAMPEPPCSRILRVRLACLKKQPF